MLKKQIATLSDWLSRADAPVHPEDARISGCRHVVFYEDGPGGALLTIEDSSRVDPWIARQAQRRRYSEPHSEKKPAIHASLQCLESSEGLGHHEACSI